MANCEGFPTKTDLTTAKQAIDHISHVSKSRDNLGNPADTVTDKIGDGLFTNLTLDGLEKLYYRAIANAGYITLDSFQDGAPGGSLTLPNQVLRDTTTGEYYRWDGMFPKSVPAGSTPASTGGVGLGAWVSVGDASLRAALAMANGNELIPTLKNNGYTPIGLDNSGSVSGNSIITSAFLSHRHILLPEGVFKLNEFTVPSGCTLEGSGRKIFNKTTGLWEGRGTLIIGNIVETDCIGVIIKNLSIDTFASGGNSIQGLSPRTGYIFVKNVATRANNHGQLWEANDNNPTNTNSIGHILIEDCLHYGGPNGLVTKHKAVSFIRCVVFDVIIQGYVVVSDNINGSNIYSRATQTVIQDCWHINDRTVNTNNEGIRIYSRDYNTSNPTVVGAYDTQIRNFNGISCAGNIIRMGENAETSSGFLKVKSPDVLVNDMPYNLTPYACFKFDSTNRVSFNNCVFGNQVNVELIHDNNEQVNVNPINNIIKAGSTGLGIEKGILTVSNNSSSLVPVAGQRIIDIQNTATTLVTGLSYGVVGKEHYILINDNFTTINLGTPYKGYGTRLHVRYNGSWWDVLSISRSLTTNEIDRSNLVSGSSFDYKINSIGLINQYINLNSGLSNITASDVASYLTAGDKIRLRIRSNTSGNITISGWSSVFKLVPSSITLSTTEKLILIFDYDGASLVLVNQTQYT